MGTDTVRKLSNSKGRPISVTFFVQTVLTDAVTNRKTKSRA